MLTSDHFDALMRLPKSLSECTASAFCCSESHGRSNHLCKTVEEEYLTINPTACIYLPDDATLFLKTKKQKQNKTQFTPFKGAFAAPAAIQSVSSVLKPFHFGSRARCLFKIKRFLTLRDL